MAGAMSERRGRFKLCTVRFTMEKNIRVISVDEEGKCEWVEQMNKSLVGLTLTAY